MLLLLFIARLAFVKLTSTNGTSNQGELKFVKIKPKIRRKPFHSYNVGPEPIYITCPSCRNAGATRVEFIPTTKTILLVMALTLFCMCWLPMWLRYTKIARHTCRTCGIFIGDSET
ncbi:unnamed protein product [Psylliodes chrysocephalus]|uniref:LITAF domain-containing protein n=1 Tax=Psylliodes chrysocephalus TaxID=3402493 RepID=A0A9P0G4R7_9CUCU|nr:unnamed protein product [Psylliodes chrysocephala]